LKEVLRLKACGELSLIGVRIPKSTIGRLGMGMLWGRF